MCKIIIHILIQQRPKLDIEKAEQDKVKRQENSSKGLLSKISSSMGDLWDGINNNQKKLVDLHIRLAEVTLLNSHLRDEFLQSHSSISDESVNELYELYQKSILSQDKHWDFIVEKQSIELQIERLTTIAKNNLSFCTGLEELKKSLEFFNSDIKQLLQANSKGIVYPYVKNSLGDEVALIDDYVVINRAGLSKFLNFFDDDANTVRIPVDSITAINYKESGFKDGTLEFVYLGYVPRFKQTRHNQENVIVFRGKEFNETFKAFQSIVEKRVRELKNKQSKLEIPLNSVADELAKFAKLHQEGILSDEEFTAKKTQLLGL